jgi:hypothetical protein
LLFLDFMLLYFVILDFFLFSKWGRDSDLSKTL